MRTTAKVPAHRDIESLLLDGMIGAWSDERLLNRFSAESGDRSERAFRAIVERHGPRVYRVCLALTGEAASAEDAFQATFLGLACKAGSLRVTESLGPWLYGVATRVASSVRTQQARRSRHEASASHRGEPTTTDRESDPDLTRILHWEIGRLPSPYREAVYLCDIEGIDQETAALRLGCAIGTIRSRLFRGRRTLRSRLVRRGVVPSLIVTLSANSTRAIPSPRLIALTAKNAAAVISSSATGAVPAAVVILFQEAMTTMLMTKIKLAIGAAVIGLSAATAVVFAQDGVVHSPDSRPKAERVVDPMKEQLDSERHSVRPDPLRSKVRQDSINPNIPIRDVESGRDNSETLKPTDQEILNKLIQEKFRDVTIQLEKVATYADSVERDPELGRTAIKHMQYKATVNYRFVDGDTTKPMVDVLYIDQANRIRVAEDQELTKLDPPPPKVAAKRQARTLRTTAKALADPLAAEDRDSRLDEVERKLDRILQALEKKQYVDAPMEIDDMPDDAPKSKIMKQTPSAKRLRKADFILDFDGDVQGSKTLRKQEKKPVAGELDGDEVIFK